jgi:hypothetical protein
VVRWQREQDLAARLTLAEARRRRLREEALGRTRQVGG